MVALRAIYGAYGGWQAAIYFTEEVNAPERNVARATFAASRVVTALYLLVNAAVLHVLPIGALVHSNLAAADAARVVLGEGSNVIVTALAILCVATLANIQIMELTAHQLRHGARRAPAAGAGAGVGQRHAARGPAGGLRRHLAHHRRRRQREGPAL